MERKPCESIVYIHYLIGGPFDGDRIPAGKKYYKLTMSRDFCKDCGKT